MGRKQVLLGQRVPLSAGTRSPTRGCRFSYTKAKIPHRSGAGRFTNIPSRKQHRKEARSLKKRRRSKSALCWQQPRPVSELWGLPGEGAQPPPPPPSSPIASTHPALTSTSLASDSPKPHASPGRQIQKARKRATKAKGISLGDCRLFFKLPCSLQLRLIIVAVQLRRAHGNVPSALPLRHRPQLHGVTTSASQRVPVWDRGTGMLPAQANTPKSGRSCAGRQADKQATPLPAAQPSSRSPFPTTAITRRTFPLSKDHPSRGKPA